MTRILLVEDSPTQAEQLRRDLEREGFIAVLAPSAERALELFESADFELVLTDIVLPGLSGCDLCRRVKAHPSRGRTPVILLTALGGPTDILRGLECGADNYLIKPCPPEIL